MKCVYIDLFISYLRHMTKRSAVTSAKAKNTVTTTSHNPNWKQVFSHFWNEFRLSFRDLAGIDVPFNGRMDKFHNFHFGWVNKIEITEMGALQNRLFLALKPALQDFTYATCLKLTHVIASPMRLSTAACWRTTNCDRVFITIVE